MDTIKVPFQGVKMVAHRGVSGLEKENSIAAFVAAGNRSYYGIECDIHSTNDGHFVVIHDADTNRVAGVDLNVETAPLDQIRSVLLLDKNGKTRGDLIIPTLEEYVSVCHRYDKVCILELKTSFSVPQLKKIVQIIQNEEHLDQTVFISFDIENLKKMRQILPTQPMQFLTGDYSEAMIETLKEYRLDLDIHYAQITKERVEALHQRGILVNCWTVDDPSLAKELYLAGVDFITSNILE